MEVQHLLPSGIASILVKRYESITNDRDEYIVDKHVPNGYASFVFNFNRGVNIAGYSTLPPFILVPPFLKAIHIETHQALDTFVVICKASVWSRLFDFDLYPRSNDNYIDLDSKFYYSLWEQLKPCKKAAERIDVFEKALQEKTSIKLYKADEIDCIYENIITDAGKNHISKIMEILYHQSAHIQTQVYPKGGHQCKIFVEARQGKLSVGQNNQSSGN
jgi:hypothetical protein